MADTKISALPSASALDGTEQIPATQETSPVKLTVNQISAKIQGDLAIQEGLVPSASALDGTEQIPATQNVTNPVKITVNQLSSKIQGDISLSGIVGGPDYYGCSFTEPLADGIREGNIDLHRRLPIHNLTHSCLLDDNGNETQQLPNGTWVGQDRSGASGQVMTAIPNYYFKCTSDSGVIRFYILNKAPQKGVKYAGWNQFFDNNIEYVYCSAYEAALDRTNSKLASVVNNTAQFRGGAGGAEWDGTYRTLLGRPVSNLNRTQFRAAARLRNTNNVCWNEYVYTIHVMMAWLAYVEYNTLNIQKAYNPALDANGFKQGALGMGVSEITNWNEYNAYMPFIPCGATDILGNGTGVVTYNVPASDGSTYYVAPVPRYRGIENPFGHIWKWCDGLNITEDGTTRLAFVTTNPSLFNDSNTTGYENRGVMAHNEGWTTAMLLGAKADLLPSNVGDSSSTYFTDYYWTNAGTGFWGAVLGGTAGSGSADGFASVDSSIRFSDAYTHFGSRLCFIPSV